MGCLFALLAGMFPRLALFIVWVAKPALVSAAFSTWLMPLRGIIFLPFATLIYVLLYTPGVGLIGWEWFWVILAAFFDVAHLAATIARRRDLMRSAQRA
jgi:hypothetical protein